MNPFLDPFTIIFLVLAVVIFLRLRNVLGRRTGNERPPIDPFPNQSERTAETNDNVVPLPDRRNGAGAPVDEFEPDFPDGALGEKLRAVHRVDGRFDPKEFLAGAEMAYEMIVGGFATGDKRNLRPLLSRDVFEGFSGAIDDRERRGETMMSDLVGIDEAEIVDAQLKGKMAHLTVKFTSKIVSAVHDANGELVSGDPNRVTEVTDIWTFSRDTTSRDPNWKLVATEEEAA